MQLYFVRHAQSQNNLLWIETASSIGRSSDPELSDIGRKQAGFLARHISSGVADIPQDQDSLGQVNGFGITHIYSSLMVRALETATAVAASGGLRVNGWLNLHEWGGIYEQDPDTLERIGVPGNSRSYLLSRFPELILPETVNEQGWWNRPFEEKAERLPRAQRFLKDILKMHSGTEDRVLVVSHMGFYNYVMRALLSLPETTEMWFVLNNTAISRLDFEEDTTRLVYSNRTDFLPLDHNTR